MKAKEGKKKQPMPTKKHHHDRVPAYMKGTETTKARKDDKLN